jgi:hypothetical protein
MFLPPLRSRAARVFLASCCLAAVELAAPRSAMAEKVLVKTDDWEVYTEGRVGAFASYVRGDGYPQPINDAQGVQIQDAQGGGWKAAIEQGAPDAVTGQPDQGMINSMRVRSGMMGNILALGVRYPITPEIKASGFIQIWAWAESTGRVKSNINYADVRQGYGKLESPYGTLLVGRQRCLFSRGATDINVNYAHKWGVGFFSSNGIDVNGPSLGQIGFGVLGSGFSAGIMYATPTFEGLQLNVGAFDPIQLQGNGAFGRTKFLRPETELTFERPLGDKVKVGAFVNGAYQKIYKEGYCEAQPGLPCEQTAAGFGYGARLEVGPVHLGVAGHRGKGLGFNYALEPSDTAIDQSGLLRLVDGYYVQSQVVIEQFDLFAGWGIARAFLTSYDKTPAQPGAMTHSIIKYHMGINGGVVYNVTPNLHVDFDYFRAAAQWYLGQSQVLNAFNTGMTVNW